METSESHRKGIPPIVASFITPIPLSLNTRAEQEAFRWSKSSERILGRRQPGKYSCVQPMANAATDEISRVITDKLNLGNVITMSRAGSSGWAAMHRATTDTGKHLFIKVSREEASMFAGEVESLRAMFNTKTVKVPEVYDCGNLNAVSGSFIVMEALELMPIFHQDKLAKSLASMHLAKPVFPEARNGQFGFCVNNTIGATPQPNGWMDDWVDFFRERRLRHQIMLTNDTNLISKGRRLCDLLDGLFEDIRGNIKPSLLHGDLWSGNVKGNGLDPTPVLFDPACYYGHHEAEFGMSWCMELSELFYEEYHKLIPKAPLFDRRRSLYQLYHYLNHYNLFGGGYYGMCDVLLTELINYLK